RQGGDGDGEGARRRLQQAGGRDQGRVALPRYFFFALRAVAVLAAVRVGGDFAAGSGASSDSATSRARLLLAVLAGRAGTSSLGSSRSKTSTSDGRRSSSTMSGERPRRCRSSSSGLWKSRVVALPFTTSSPFWFSTQSSRST